MRKLNELEYEIIKKELIAFHINFKPIEIIKNDSMYYVNDYKTNYCIFSANNIQQLKGWLYGAIQAKNNIIS